MSASAVGRLGDALGRVYAALDALQPTEANYDNVRLVRPDEPLGQLLQAAAAGRFAGHAPRAATPFRSLQLSLLGFEEALIYPPVGRMTSTQVLQTIATLMNRTGLVSPSRFELAGGRTLSAVPVGIDMDFSGDRASMVSVRLYNTATGQRESLPAVEIVDIR